ncbi:metallophosphoesterase family protein [Planctomyces sp. SH-PL14]|uniref:metallophosphoesterase family protein n=1 Tax=Planctomyces sp. SH-PL14 TaxID=1632864 RepID=UPI00078CB7B0|nr:metallophosphoesterase [Planctomyces sp. SH-PL14]AMV19065.1 3',5'-cyclic adenosine monophosphate phosphodiesterase CpdA [Planctomyces sp. SH-PL14]
MLNRREFLTTLSAVPLLTTIPALAQDAAKKPLRFGLITDVHQDIIPDASARLGAFVDAMTRAEVDFIAQLGDFCIPKEANRGFYEVWERFQGPKYHVLGNHDMDGGFTREQTVRYYGMPHRYYAFQQGGVKFIVLDGNDPGGTSQGYKRFVGQEQAEWLRKELSADARPVVILIHQPLDGPSGVDNFAEIGRILKGEGGARPNVLAVFSGHLHQDYHRPIDGVHHIQVNSASYYWMGAKYNHRSYGEAAHEKSPYLQSTCPYEGPLWAVVTLDLAKGALTVEGMKTAWLGGSPWDVGATPQSHDAGIVRPEVSPRSIVLA